MYFFYPTMKQKKTPYSFPACETIALETFTMLASSGGSDSTPSYNGFGKEDNWS